MNKKTFATIGMICSAIILLMGILVMTGAMGGDASSASSASYPYDSGYASFGADFYTYVSNNAAEAASAARTIASNLKNLSELLKNGLGLLLIAFGMFGVCHFGMLRCDCIEPAAPVSEESENNAEETSEYEETEEEPAADEV